MRKLTSIVAAVATLGAVDIIGAGTPFSTVQIAQADALPSVWQLKAKKLAQNIHKYRKSLADKGPDDFSDAFKKKQMLDRMANFEASLKKIPQADDPNLNAAKEQFAAMQKEFAALAGASGATAAQPAAENSGTPSTGTATAATPAPAADDGPELVSGQRVRVKKLAKDIANVMGDIIVTGPSPLQSGEIVGKYNKRMKQFADALGRYEPYKNDPDVKQAASNYNAFVAAITTEYKRAEAQKQQLGDVQARLAQIEKNLFANPKPEGIYSPFNDADAKAWLEGLVNTKEASLTAAAEIQEIAPLAYLPKNGGTVQSGAPYDGQDLDRLFRFANETAGKVDTTIENTQEHLKNQFSFQNEVGLKFLREMDPNDDHHKSNSYLSEDSEGRILEQIDREMAIAKSVSAYQRAFGKDPSTNTKNRIDEIAGLRKKYLEDRIKLIGDSKLPEPASTDSARLKVAEEVLAIPKYEFGEHGPVVLTSEKIITREEVVRRDTIKDVDVSLSGAITLSGTSESWTYIWDEFKFATPIKDPSGDWYIWWITAKKYASGASTTPIGYWVSGKATKGSLILEKNF